MAQVQAVINRLESYGYPVHRYHADRAQELKSAALVAWLRDKGIHTTWTPGDTPAGNRAELAVQQLKATARKLLAVAGLEMAYWPLAVLHASARHWAVMADFLGIPQPALLPFGMVLHARRRFETGYKSHWRERTVQGRYMGLAPNTPGGHLVLVPDDSEGHKVLLTSTVYPLRAKTPSSRPTLRLRSKTSPEFALRALSMWDVRLSSSACHATVARFSPGGEWAWSGVESEGSGMDSEGSDGWGWRGKKGIQKDHALKVQQVRPGGAESAPNRQRLVSWARDHAPEEQQIDGTNNWIGDFECKFTEGFFCDIVDGQVKTALEKPTFTRQECLSVLRTCGGVSCREEWGFELVEGSAVFGLLGEGKFAGVPGGCLELVKYLNGFVRRQGCEAPWTTIGVSCNRYPNWDSLSSSEWPCCVSLLGDVKGGGLWVEGDSDLDLAVRWVPGSGCRTGHVEDAFSRLFVLKGGAAHLIEPWTGGDLWILKTWVADGVGGGAHRMLPFLQGLGFNLELSDGRLPITGSRVSNEASGTDSIWNGDEGCDPCGALESGNSEWEVDFPHELLSVKQAEAWTSLHEAALYRCRAASLDLGVVSIFGARDVAEAERGWYEEVLRKVQAWEEGPVRISSLQAEVPLSPLQPSVPEQFLQTRTVSLEEARRELWEWLEPARDEVVALEDTTRAVERISIEEVDCMVSEGRRVLQVPGKAVLTRKSGIGKRRFRAVCCGNYLPASEMGTNKADLYAGGVDSLTVRVVLAYSAQYPAWTLCVLDIKTAFLYAPVRGSSEEDPQNSPVIIVRPPYMLVQLQLLRSTDRWKVRRALYGLATSPRDWANYRDSVLRQVEVRAPLVASLNRAALMSPCGSCGMKVG